MGKGAGVTSRKRFFWGRKKLSHDEGVGGTTCLEVVFLTQEF